MIALPTRSVRLKSLAWRGYVPEADKTQPQAENELLPPMAADPLVY
jgi:hypothetical protein